MRALACQTLGIDSRVNVNALLRSQSNDGGWGPGSLSRYGTTGTLIGNRGVTTAFAIKAIAGAQLQYWDAPKRLEKETSEPLGEVDKCEVEDNRNEAETAEAEVEPEA